MGGSRIAYRIWKEQQLTAMLRPASRPVLVAGSGETADSLLRELAHSPVAFHAIGLLDDSPDKQGRLVQGTPVLGRLEETTVWAEKMGVQDIVLVLPSAASRNAAPKRG